MTRATYNLASLIPANVYAAQVRRILVDLHRELEQMPARDFAHIKLDGLLRRLATQYEVTPADLCGMLHLVLESTGTPSDVIDTMESLGQAGSLGYLGTAITMLSDVARQ